MTESPVPPLAVTMGEPAGIGSEITLKAWMGRTPITPAFFVIDDPAKLARRAEALGFDVPIRVIDDPSETTNVFSVALPVLRSPLDVEITPGAPDKAAAASVLRSIDMAVELALGGRAGAVVTNPIQKQPLYEAGFVHPGHTEYLGALAGPDYQAVMMLACPGLRVVPVTTHLPLAGAVAALSREIIVQHGRIAAAALVADFGISRPRLAVAALNPHAGESGTIGREERDIIGPAVADLARSGIDASGPTPADSLFHERARAEYDAVLCMYHDQALIPLKTIDFAGGINITLGLPFVRTSPDHGTALDIAGQGRADPSSFVAALAAASDIAGRRRAGAATVSAGRDWAASDRVA
jgi:4-hydroxythreonine-4-phosphate dehydrogenase